MSSFVDGSRRSLLVAGPARAPPAAAAATLYCQECMRPLEIIPRSMEQAEKVVDDLLAICPGTRAVAVCCCCFVPLLLLLLLLCVCVFVCCVCVLCMCCVCACERCLRLQLQTVVV